MRKKKIDTPIQLPEKLTEKFVKRIAEIISESREDTELVLRKFIGYCFRKKEGDYSTKITPRQLKNVIQKKNTLLNNAIQ